jgi:hypothetical protein
MSALPVPLQPWAEWLALFPADQAALLGEPLVRLSPLLGPIRQRAASAAHEPEGVGAIARRGGFERLLISQWAYADAAPDEFMRRAAHGELLFTGPEPATSRRPFRCVALFDAGPAQLGAPRLLHVAMLILLARRADLVGAQFQWGLLQDAGLLHEDAPAAAIKRLLGARSFASANRDDADIWDAMFDATPDECWLIGDPDACAPAAVNARLQVRRSWQAEELEVALTQQGRTRALALPLPDAECTTRLLRQLASPSDGGRATVTAPATHALRRPPLFGTQAGWIAAPTLDGNATIYHIPQSLHAPPGRPRVFAGMPHAERIIAVGLFKRSLGVLALRKGALHPTGFPGQLFSGANVSSLAMPAREAFHAVPGTAHWAPVFHLRCNASMERLLVLDAAGGLVCWTRILHRDGRGLVDEFRLIATGVIGATQGAHAVTFAVANDSGVQLYMVTHLDLSKTPVGARLQRGDRYHFGADGVYALRRPDQRWLAGTRGGGAIVEVERDSEVLGCARGPWSEQAGLVVLSPNRKRIEFHTEDQRRVLVDSGEKIARASVDPHTGRVAWLTDVSRTLVVQGIGDKEPCLRVLSREAQGEG